MKKLVFAMTFVSVAILTGCRKEAPQLATEAAEKHKHKHDGSDMPKGVSGTPFERELFLKPGGVYSDADIQANGNTVPSAKYGGISWPHEDEIQKGDKVCPVTANKSDERCHWIVNAKRYEFCCTPCLDKFVKWAKEQPEKIKDPADYVRK